MSGNTFGPTFGMSSSGSAPTPDVLDNSNPTSGVITGLGMMLIGDLEISIAPGTGQIVTYGDDGIPVVEKVAFYGIPSYNVTFGNDLPNDNSACYFLAYNKDKTKDVTEFSSQDLSPSVLKEWVVFGGYEVCKNASGKNYISIYDVPLNFSRNTIGGLLDGFAGLIGPGNIEGNEFTPNGDNLILDRSAGTIWSWGSNYRNNVTLPCNLTLDREDGVRLTRVFCMDTGGGFPGSKQYLVDGGLSDVVNPNKYSDGGNTLANVSANAFTVQVIYIANDGSIVVAYGQEEFDSMDHAYEALKSGAIRHKEQSPLTMYVIRCYLIVRQGTVSLNIPENARFVHAGKFRGTALSGN